MRHRFVVNVNRAPIRHFAMNSGYNL